MALHFDREPSIRDFIEFRRREIFEELQELVPYADIEHVGSTAVPGGWTSGTVDVQVRVEKDRFAEAKKEIGGKYEAQDGGTKELALFGHAGRGIRVFLTVGETDSDLYTRQRNFLIEQPLVRERLDAIHRKFNGEEDAAGYAAAKEAFWKEWAEKAKGS